VRCSYDILRFLRFFLRFFAFLAATLKKTFFLCFRDLQSCFGTYGQPATFYPANQAAKAFFNDAASSLFMDNFEFRESLDANDPTNFFIAT
jgi:hypothetical protein